MADSKPKIKLFISYSHDDETYFNVLSEGLKKIVKNSQEFEWEIWDDTKIYVGTFWDDEIQNNIKNCNVALLLVSVGFMSSNYIKEREFKEFTKKYEEKGILIVPIVFKPCDFNRWEDLGKLQFFKPSGSNYNKSEIKDFTYADLLRFKDTDGTLIQNPNLDRYHLDLVTKIEESFKDFIKRNEISIEEAEIVKLSESKSENLNKLSDYATPSSLFTGREKEMLEFKTAYKTFRIFAVEGLGGTGKTQITAKFIEDNIPDKNRIIWLRGQSSFDAFVENAGYGDVLKGEKKSNLALYSGLKDLIEKDERIIFWDNYNDYEDNSFNEFLSFANHYLKKATLILITKTDPIIDGFTLFPSIKIEGLKDDAIQYALKLKSSNLKYQEISETDLEKICNAVDGHPLAIEFSMLLISYGKTADDIIMNMPEFSTLRKVEEFSKRLFLDILNHSKTSEEEKECFLRCSVFNQKFTIEEIKSLYDGKDVFNYLSGLIDKLLISFKEGFYEIHPLVRSFSYEKIVHKKDINNKAANYFISKRGDDIEIKLEEKIFYHLSESENWEAINKIIEDNGEQLVILGQLSFLSDSISKLKTKNISNPMFDILLGDIYQIKGEWDTAIIHFENASKNLSNKKIRVEGEIRYGEILFRKANLSLALQYFEKAYEFAKNNNLKKEEARAMNDIGLVNLEYDKLDIALQKFKSALKIRNEISDFDGILSSKNNIANVFNSKNQFEKALDIYTENIKTALKKGDKISLCLSYGNIAGILKEQNKLGEAFEKVSLALKISEEIGDKENFATSLNTLGLIYSYQGRRIEALEEYNKSLLVREEIGDLRGIASCYHNIGVFYIHELINYKMAISYLFRSLSLCYKTDTVHTIKSIKSWIKNIVDKIGKIEFTKLAEEVILELNENFNLREFLNEPVIATKKYQRNDKIKVKCTDGSVKEGKYKNFESDINSGKCEIIE